jgi:hypothetical protein
MAAKPPRGPLIRRNQFKDHGIPTGEKKTVEEWITKHNFPKPYEFGERTHLYSLPEIYEFAESSMTVSRDYGPRCKNAEGGDG